MIRIFSKRFRQYKYSFFFISMIAMLFIRPMIGDKFPFLVPLFFFMLMFGVLSTLEIKKKHFFATLTVGVIALITHLVELNYIQEHEGWNVMYFCVDVFYILFFSTTIFFMLGHVFSAKKVTWDTIQGGISIYYLIGLVWAMFYGIVINFDSKAISFPGEVENFSGSLTYFSFTTLTTLGYGDILPVSDMARNLTILESTLGPLFLTVLVARLVGLHVASQRNIE